MHLFDINRQNLFSKPNHEVYGFPMLEYPEQNKIDCRKERWIDFFNEHSTCSICFLNHTLDALDRVFETNNLIKLQTEVELGLSFEFYKKLFTLRKPLYFSSVGAAQKYLVLSLIYSKYPGVFFRSIDEVLKNLELEINESNLDELFRISLVKYETPSFIIRNFQFLTSNEIDIVIGALNGKNLRNHKMFLMAPSKNEFSLLMTLEAVDFPSKDNVLIRGLIRVKLSRLDVNLEYVTAFIRSSKVYQSDPTKYYKDIDFWSRALQLSYAGRGYLHYNLTDIIDFLEYMKYVSLQEYSLKGRTTDSLLRIVDLWHGRIFSDAHYALRKLEWSGLESEFDLTFEFQENIYQCVQLKSGEELFDEGTALQHCAITYAQSCLNGHCIIWSMQRQSKDNFYRIMTIEVIDKVIVQARTLNNEVPNSTEMELLFDWSERMDYSIELYKNE